MKFQLRTCLPLIISHLKQVNLWHGTRDIQQHIDPAEAIKDYLSTAAHSNTPS